MQKHPSDVGGHGSPEDRSGLASQGELAVMSGAVFVSSPADQATDRIAIKLKAAVADARDIHEQVFAGLSTQTRAALDAYKVALNEFVDFRKTLADAPKMEWVIALTNVAARDSEQHMSTRGPESATGDVVHHFSLSLTDGSHLEVVERTERNHPNRGGAGSDPGAWLESGRSHTPLSPSETDSVAPTPNHSPDLGLQELHRISERIGALLNEARDDNEWRLDLDELNQELQALRGRIHTRHREEVFDSEPESALRYVIGALGDVMTSDELADLFGVTVRTLSAWKNGGAVKRHASRVVLLAQLVQALHSSWTPRGIVGWLVSKKAQIGMTPMELMDQDLAAAWAKLPALARGEHVAVG